MYYLYFKSLKIETPLQGPLVLHVASKVVAVVRAAAARHLGEALRGVRRVQWVEALVGAACARGRARNGVTAQAQARAGLAGTEPRSQSDRPRADAQ